MKFLDFVPFFLVAIHTKKIKLYIEKLTVGLMARMVYVVYVNPSNNSPNTIFAIFLQRRAFCHLIFCHYYGRVVPAILLCADERMDILRSIALPGPYYC